MLGVRIWTSKSGKVGKCNYRDIEKRGNVVATAASCDFEEVVENQGLWDLERGFLYQIYTRKLRIWGCDVAGKIIL